ncbi:MAG: SlyX family protein [Pararhodobacter sp.]|nr:SlyX family protein [Pararhodobacter sp.]
MQDRLNACEERIAHLLRAVDDLSDMVRAQGVQIDRMQRQLGQMIEREAAREMETGGGVPLSDQRPPHW